MIVQPHETSKQFRSISLRTLSWPSQWTSRWCVYLFCYNRFWRNLVRCAQGWTYVGHSNSWSTISNKSSSHSYQPLIEAIEFQFPLGGSWQFMDWLNLAISKGIYSPSDLQPVSLCFLWVCPTFGCVRSSRRTCTLYWLGLIRFGQLEHVRKRATLPSWWWLVVDSSFMNLSTASSNTVTTTIATASVACSPSDLVMVTFLIFEVVTVGLGQ
jgi:hypothetical protein